jgi:hypothetical protein
MFAEAEEILPNARGEYSDVPSKWRRLINYPQGLVT